MIMNSEKSDEEVDDTFYFESDHLALRGNVDYSELLKTLFVLQAQRNRAIKDYNKVVEIRNECLEDPLNFHEKRRNGTLVLPELQKTVEIPKIDWSKFETKVPEAFMRQLSAKSAQTQSESFIEEKAKRIKAWTTEEQRKLEELLVKYPPEELESKRITKIANEMGTRTKHQVASRLQKYYLKLLKAGLPLPGPMPKCGKYTAANRAKKGIHSYKKYARSSTFFPETIIPVVMDQDHAPGPSNADVTFSPKVESQHHNYLLTNDYLANRERRVRKDDAVLHVDILKAVKAEKLLESSQRLHQHFGFKCDYCEEEPIQGARWHCTICTADSVDYCNDCMISQMYCKEPHDLLHKFTVIRNDKEIAVSPWSDDEEDMDDEDNDDEDLDDNNENHMEEDMEDHFDDEMEETNEDSADSVENTEAVRKTNDDEAALEISEQCPIDIFGSDVNGDVLAGHGDGDGDEDEDMFDIIN